MTTELSTRDDAVARAERIRAGIRSLAELQQDITDAYHARDWETLGYDSWDGYVSGEFGSSLPRLDRSERRELVVNLRAEGLSTRAIASATGAARNTVKDDLRQVDQFDPPDPEPEPAPVTGLDGKQYQPKPSTTEQEEELVNQPRQSARKRRPLPDTAKDTGWALRKDTEKLERIFTDDRFRQYEKEVATHLRGHLQHTVEVCQDLLDRLNQQGEV